MKNAILILSNYAVMFIESPTYGIIPTLISLEDIPKVQDIKWRVNLDKTCNKFYIRGSNNERLNRFLLDCPKNMVVDHINRDTLDNRISNLRIVTQKENNLNRVQINAHKDSTVAYNGISIHHVRKTVNGKTYAYTYYAVKKVGFPRKIFKSLEDARKFIERGRA